MGKVPCKPEGSHKRARIVIMTNILAAPTRHPHTENLRGEKCAYTGTLIPKNIQREGRAGSKGG